VELLPAQRNIQIRQERTKITENMLRGHDAAVLVCESEHAKTRLDELPLADTWRALHRQAQSAGSVGILTATLTVAGSDARALPGRRGRRHDPDTEHNAARVLPIALAFVNPGASAFERLSLAARAWKALGAPPGTRILLATHGLACAPATAMLEALLAAALAGSAPMPTWKSKSPRPASPTHITLAGATADPVDVARCTAIDRGNHLARWLTMLPPNVLNSLSYPRALRTLARQRGWEYAFLDEAALKRLGAGAFLAVSRANEHRRAGIVRLSYRGAGKRAARRSIAEAALPARLALVGKGICFDTGGINLKPHKSMYQMHEDMQGSAVAVGTLLSLSELKLPCDIDCWLAISENQTGARAFRPQDVVHAANGVSIQVVHSDAEGRMVLADTLALATGTGTTTSSPSSVTASASRSTRTTAPRPGLIMDFATLTGACISALTERYSGIFTNRPEWHEALTRTGRDCGERVWPFPMDEDYDSELDSRVADVLQCSVDSKGDHILAARFLNRFVPPEVPWIHLDLSSGNRSGGLGHVPTDFTGFGVRYASELLLGGRLPLEPRGEPREDIAARRTRTPRRTATAAKRGGRGSS